MFDPRSYWKERLTNQFNVAGVGDIGLTRSYNEALYRVRSSVFRRCARKLSLSPAQSRVLDVGSGTGFYVSEWLTWGVGKTSGSDLTDASVGRLRERFPRCDFFRFDIGGAMPPELAESHFDAVSCFDVLFHIVDDTRYRIALGHLAAFVRKGGSLLISENLVNEQGDVEHQVMRTEREILELLAAAGCRVRRRIPMFVVMNDPVRRSNRAWRVWFALVHRLASRAVVATVAGWLLLPFEFLAVRIVRNGPSTEVLVCERA